MKKKYLNWLQLKIFNVVNAHNNRKVCGRLRKKLFLTFSSQDPITYSYYIQQRKFHNWEVRSIDGEFDSAPRFLRRRIQTAAANVVIVLFTTQPSRVTASQLAISLTSLCILKSAATHRPTAAFGNRTQNGCCDQWPIQKRLLLCDQQNKLGGQRVELRCEFEDRVFDRAVFFFLVFLIDDNIRIIVHKCIPMQSFNLFSLFELYLL